MISGLYPGVTTVELDNLAAETAATMTTKHPDYAILAARIAVSNLHKETKKVFSGMALNMAGAHIDFAEWGKKNAWRKGIKMYQCPKVSCHPLRIARTPRLVRPKNWQPDKARENLLFSDVMEDLYNWVNPKTKCHSPMISEKAYKTIMANADVSVDMPPTHAGAETHIHACTHTHTRRERQAYTLHALEVLFLGRARL